MLSPHHITILITLQEIVKDREAWKQSMESQTAACDLETEQQEQFYISTGKGMIN